MPVEPAKKIYETPVIRREENTIQSQRRKPRQDKKEGNKEQRKVDIKI